MSIEIILDNYNGAFYPGQTITGKLQCHFNKQKNLRGVRIKFKGRAETEWYESESHYNHTTKKHETRRVHYSAEETYFEQEFTLIQGGENFMLPQGRHVYPFSYILPQQLPSSFEGSYGNVRYTIRGVVDRPWKFDYETKIQVNLISPLDLNYLPGLRDPLNTSVDKDICCCWCKSGPVTFEVSIPVRGFCPGQRVDIGAYVQNMSNVSAERVAFKIYKNIEFISHYPSTHHRHEEYTVAACEEGGIGAHGEKSWTSSLEITANDIYPNLIPCSIINISYTIKGKVVLPCPHTNLDVEFPCMIGTVPLTDSAPTFLGPPNSEVPLPTYNSISGIEPMPYVPVPIIGDATAPLPSESAHLLHFPSGDSKYPPPSQPPYPSGNQNFASDGLPYPNNFSGQPSSTPYPSASGTPYPPANSALYPPPSGVTSFPSGGGAPYPPGGAPYPSTGSYNPASGPNEKTPFPNGDSSPYSSAPYPSAPAGSLEATAPPSYEEAKQLDKNDKK